MSGRSENKAVWWGSFAFDEDEAGFWRVGPTTLWIHRSSHSWGVIYSSSHDSMDEAAEVRSPKQVDRTDLNPEDPPVGAHVLRFSFRKQVDTEIILTPALADRAIVVRPDSPLYVLAGEEITIFASSPVWIRVEAGAPARFLTEIPSHRPTDTWFGPNTQEGELCYAVKTAGRLRLDKLPIRFHRAVTPIHVRNHAPDALLFERIQIPIQYLSLYESAEGLLWTQPVVLNRESSGDVAAVHLEQKSPMEAGETHLLSGPRLQLRANVIMRTFSSIFSR